MRAGFCTRVALAGALIVLACCVGLGLGEPVARLSPGEADGRQLFRQGSEVALNPLEIFKRDVRRAREVIAKIRANIQSKWAQMVDNKDQGHFMALGLIELRKFRRRVERHMGLRQDGELDEDEPSAAQKIYSDFMRRAEQLMQVDEAIRRASLESITKRTAGLIESVFLEDIQEVAIILFRMMLGDTSKSDFKSLLLIRMQTKLINYFAGVLLDVLSCIYGKKLELPPAFEHIGGKIFGAVSGANSPAPAGQPGGQQWPKVARDLTIQLSAEMPDADLKAFEGIVRREMEEVRMARGETQAASGEKKEDYSWMLHNMID